MKINVERIKEEEKPLYTAKMLKPGDFFTLGTCEDLFICTENDREVLVYYMRLGGKRNNGHFEEPKNCRFEDPRNCEVFIPEEVNIKFKM